MSDKTFSQVLNFTRASTGTYFDPAGVLQTAAVDEPRFTHDPVSLESLGLLIEEQRTNLLLWSEDFDDAVWTLTRATISANSVNAPDGALTADKLVEDSSTGSHFVNQTVNYVSGNTYTFSTYAAPAERQFLRMFFSAAAFEANLDAYFDLVNGTVSGISSGLVAEIVQLNSGFYRCSIQATATSTAAANTILGIADGSGVPSYAGDGTSGIYIWGAQIEEGPFPTSYIKTEGSQVTRSADNCSRTLGSEFNANEGTVFLKFFWDGSQIPSNQGVLTLSDNNLNSNSNSIVLTTGEKIRVRFSADLDFSDIGPLILGENKVSFSYIGESSGDGFACANGGPVFSGSYTDRVQDGMDSLNIGYYASTPLRFNGSIIKASIKPRPLSATELQELTAP